MQKLTRRQDEILTFIRDCIRRQGYPPTRNEIALRFGFRSPNAAEAHLRALDRKGAIRLESGVSRGIRVVGGDEAESAAPAHFEQLPLIGRVAAGQPILATEHIEDHCAVDPALFKPRPNYLLRVRGDSMIEAGILDGDLLAVHRTPEARDGQIVVARIEDEVTVKRFRREGDRVLLIAENPSYDPIEVDLRTSPLTIEGLGVGVIRERL